MSNHLNDEPIDPRLKGLLAELKTTSPRDPGKAARGKANFLAEADAVFAGAQPTAASGERPLSWLDKLKLFRLSLGQRAVLTSVLLAVALLLLFSGGAGVTALAARSALPGDALYPVKTSLEDTRVTLTNSSARQVDLQLEFAQRRLNEIEALIAQGRYADVEIATREFNLHIQSALASLENLASVDPVRGAALAAKITSDLTRYAQALSGMTENAPEMVRSELQRSIQTSETGGMVNVKPDGEIEFVGFIEQINPDELIVNGQIVRLAAQTEFKTHLQVGLLVKVHARRYSDGSLVATEIEFAQLAPGFENANFNGSDDCQPITQAQIWHDNEAINANDEDRDQSNANVNENENSDNSNDAGAGNINDNKTITTIEITITTIAIRMIIIIDNDNDNHNDNDGRNDNQNKNDNDHNENKNENG